MKANCILSLVAAVLLAGCASTGAKFDLGRVNDIKPGITEAADLMAWFGKPWSKRPQNDGTIRYLWQYTKGAIAVGVTEQQALTVFVRADGKVRDFSLKQKD